MGRISTLVLIGLGAFFIALAPLLKFWAAGQIISAPANQFGISHRLHRNRTGCAEEHGQAEESD